MKKSIELLPEIKLVGITARTSNALEMNPSTAQIGLTMQRFFGEQMQNKIAHRKTPGRIFSIYTNYESDEQGAYTYFLGEAVSHFDAINTPLETLTIPAQTYVKWTSDPGAMLGVVIDLWKMIWNMNASELGGKRAYLADFEIYDERSHDPNHAVVDVFVGIDKTI